MSSELLTFSLLRLLVLLSKDAWLAWRFFRRAYSLRSFLFKVVINIAIYLEVEDCVLSETGTLKSQSLCGVPEDLD